MAAELPEIGHFLIFTPPPQVYCEEQELRFPPTVLRQRCVQKLVVHNDATVEVPYWIDVASNPVFHVSPAQGLLPASGSVELTVTFQPQHALAFVHQLDIVLQHHAPLAIQLFGLALEAEGAALPTTPLQSADLDAFGQRLRGGLAHLAPSQLRKLMSERRVLVERGALVAVKSTETDDAELATAPARGRTSRQPGRKGGDADLVQAPDLLSTPVTGPLIEVTNAIVDFGRCPAGSRKLVASIAPRPLVVRNNTRAPMRCFWQQPGDDSPFTVSPAVVDVPPGSSVSCYVKCRPLEANCTYSHTIEGYAIYQEEVDPSVEEGDLEAVRHAETAAAANMSTATATVSVTATAPATTPATMPATTTPNKAASLAAQTADMASKRGSSQSDRIARISMISTASHTAGATPDVTITDDERDREDDGTGTELSTEHPARGNVVVSDRVLAAAPLLPLRLPSARLLAHLSAATLSEEESRLAGQQMAAEGSTVDEGRGESEDEEGVRAANAAAVAAGKSIGKGRGSRLNSKSSKGPASAGGAAAGGQGSSATAAAAGVSKGGKAAASKRPDSKPKSSARRAPPAVLAEADAEEDDNDDSSDGGLFDGVEADRGLRDAGDVLVEDASGTESEDDGADVKAGHPMPVFEPPRVLLPPSHLGQAKFGMLAFTNPAPVPIFYDFRRASFESDWHVVPVMGVVPPGATRHLVVGSVHKQPGRFDMRATCELHGARSRTLSARVLASAHDVQLVPLNPSVFLPPVALGHQCSTTLALQCTSTVSCYYHLEIPAGGPAISLQPDNGVLQVRVRGLGEREREWGERETGIICSLEHPTPFSLFRCQLLAFYSLFLHSPCTCVCVICLLPSLVSNRHEL
jgi:hypothetical protein